jgi:DNA-directed RNA polymerase subunit RPC12/RpoP
MNQNQDVPLLLEHQCPQCGAPLSIEETTRLVACPYCRVRHYINVREFVRYVVSPLRANPLACVFVPYWRLRGMEYMLEETEIKSTFIDTTMCASSNPLFPHTLGFRQQTLKTTFALPNAQGTFIQSAFDSNEFVKRLKKQRAAMETISASSSSIVREQSSSISSIAKFLMIDRYDPPKTASISRYSSDITNSKLKYREFIGETISLIYFPYYSKNGRCLDGVSEKDIGAWSQPESLGREDTKSTFLLSLLPVMCPQCGSNMDGAKDSLALGCSHCSTVWRPNDDSWQQMQVSIMDDPSIQADIHIPFYCMRPESETITCKTFADLIRLTNIAKPLTQQAENSPLSLWIPAFRMEPQRFLLLGKLATIAQAKTKNVDALPNGAICPVTISFAEAAQAMQPLLLSITANKKNLGILVGENHITAQSFSLVYIPFVKRGYEFVQPAFNAAVHENTVKWGMKSE